jgi:hypothetical protein
LLFITELIIYHQLNQIFASQINLIQW